MGNFTSQKLFQQINSSNTKGSKQTQGKSGFGGSETVMTLAEHDKKVHGGHYDGGRCKFREQMEAKGLLKPNGGDYGNPMQNVPTSGVATKVNENTNANANPVQEDGELKTKFGSVNTTSKEAMEDINEIQKLHSEAKSPEAKQKIEEIYKGLVQKLGTSESGEQSNVDVPKDDNNSPTSTKTESEKWKDALSKMPRVRISKDPSNKMTKIDAATLSDVLRGNGGNGLEPNKTSFITEDGERLTFSNEYKMSNGMRGLVFKKDDGTEVHGNAFSLPSMYLENDVAKYRSDTNGQSSNQKHNGQEDTFTPKTHDDVAEWYDKKSTELETRKNNGEISEEEYNRLQDDLDTKSDGYHESIEKSSNSGTQNNDSSNASPSKKDVSNHRKSLQDALRDQIYDRLDNGKATKEDEGGLDFMDAHEENDRKLREGKITAEEHAKNKSEINNDMMRRQYAQKYGVKYTPYVPKNSQGKEPNQVKQPTLSEQRESLQKSLSTLQMLFGKNSIVGNAIGNNYGKKIAQIDQQIEEQKKTEEEVKNIGEEAKKVIRDSAKGSGDASNRGLRTIHGDINHGGNSEIQKLIEEMESEYSNAKNTGEKMVILNRFKKLKSMYDQPKPNESSPKKESPTKSQRDTSSDPFPELTSKLKGMGESDAFRTYQDLLSKASREDMELDDKDKHMLNILGTRFKAN